MKVFKKIVAVVVSIIMGLLFVASFVYIFFEFRGKPSKFTTITASADDSGASSASDIDYTKYPSMNVLPYPYAFGDSFLGGDVVDVSVNEDGSFSVYSNHNRYLYLDLYLANAGEGLTLDGNYTLSVSIEGEGLTGNEYVRGGIFFTDSDGLYASCVPGVPVTCDFTGRELQRIQLGFGRISIYTTVKVTLNAGDIAYPYMPSYFLIKDKSYNEGNAADGPAYNRGYEEGYFDAAEKLSVGYLGDITYSASWRNEEGEYVNSFYEFSTSYSKAGMLGVDFLNFYNQNIDLIDSMSYLNFYIPLYYSEEQAILYKDLTLFLSLDKVFEGNLIIYFTPFENDVDIPFELKLCGERLYELRAPNSYVFDDSTIDIDLDTLKIESIRIYVDLSSEIQYLRLSTGTSTSALSYQLGYQEGEFYGSSSGYTKGYEEGYDSGKSAGDENGYLRGYDKGKADAYDKQASTGTVGSSVRSFVFALFDAPIDAFMSVFNFEVDGFDIGGFVTFIMSLGLIAFIMKLVL